MTQPSGRVRALLRDLSGLAAMAESLEKIDSLEQAEREAQNRMDALRAEVATATEAAAREVEAAKAEARRVLDGIAAEVEAAKKQKAQLDQQVAISTKVLAQALEEGEKAKAELQQTRDQLFKIASRIGG